jgi:hypothetical protein
VAIMMGAIGSIAVLLRSDLMRVAERVSVTLQRG